MSGCEALKREFSHANPEDKLRILRSELQRPIITIQSVAELLKEAEADGLKELPQHVSPEEFDHLIEWLRQAGEDIREILEALAIDGEPEREYK